MAPSDRPRLAATSLLLAALASSGPLAAQEHDQHLAAAAVEVMDLPMLAGPHLLVTPPRALVADDSARASAIVAALRLAIDKYRNVRVAEADGFRMFAPKMRQQRIYHFTDRRAALDALIRFDPSRPTSLLYRPQPDGTLELIGAMYTAPGWATPGELNARVPTSIAPWHQHVNICVPQRGEPERWTEMRDGRPVFGPRSTIATRASCDAVGGRFREKALGWMVHVNVFAGDDAAAIWGDAHRHGIMAGSFRASRDSSPAP